MRTRTKLVLFFSAGIIAGAGLVLGFSFKETAPNENTVEVKESGKLQYKWYTPELPKSLDFAGERVPLDRWEVRERLDRDLTVNYYAHGGTIYILKMAARYFPYIEERLRANGVPDDFKYLCVAESSLQPNVTSPVGAASLWQFMKDTGVRYGMEINDDVDERYNLKKSTDAACAYFKDSYQKFGSWTAAAASYNCGQGGYNKQATYQAGASYYDMAFPEETNRYVFRILALKCIVSHPAAYGYMIEGNDVYKPIKAKTVDVTSTVTDLNEFARSNGTSYKLLKLANPWLRSRTLPVKAGKTYQVEIPLDKQ